LLDGSDSKFTFGQHVGLSYHEVLQKFPGYYLWGKEQKSPSKGLADFLDWATDNYEVDGESHEVIPRMLPLEVASPVARKCTASQVWEAMPTFRSRHVWTVGTQPGQSVRMFFQSTP
jgi:hypothetical protein